MTSDILLNMFFPVQDYWNGHSYNVRIRLDDSNLPSHTVDFRLALANDKNTFFLHRCFLPPGQSASKLPVVTLFRWNKEEPCATAPLVLPQTDLVYGEYTAPAASASITYPAGTVLAYPRTTVFPTKVKYTRPLFFIVYKPCAASVMRGAVPIGRVMSCVAVRDDATPPRDSGNEPFDALVLQKFEERLNSRGRCCCKNEPNHARVQFLSFTSK